MLLGKWHSPFAPSKIHLDTASIMRRLGIWRRRTAGLDETESGFGPAGLICMARAAEIQHASRPGVTSSFTSQAHGGRGCRARGGQDRSEALARSAVESIESGAANAIELIASAIKT
jgi:hypothetical protein